MSDLKREIQQTKPFHSLEQETLLNLQRTASEIVRPTIKCLNKHGLSLSLYNILRILRGQNGKALSCSGISDRMVSRDSDITRLIDRLLKIGLVGRVRSEEDRRVVLTSINKQGLDLLAVLDEPMKALDKASLSHLTKEEKIQLNRLLDKARNPIKQGR